MEGVGESMQEEVIIVKYSPEEKEKWNAFLDKAKNPLFMFHRDYMEYHSDRFKDHSLMFYRKGELAALFPANERGEMLQSHGGLTCGGLILGTKGSQRMVDDCIRKLTEYAGREGFRSILYKTIPHIYHLQPAEEDIYALYRQGAALTYVSASTVIDLRAPIKMTKGRKAQISRARREGVIVKRLVTKEEYATFMKLENNVLKSRHGVRAVHSADEMHLLYTRFPGQICLLGAFLDENLIAGTILFVYDQAVHTQYMAASDTAREIGALDLTIATAIEQYSESKLWFDFGTSTEGDGTYLNEGLISQKEGFGGRTNVYEQWKIMI